MLSGEFELQHPRTAAAATTAMEDVDAVVAKLAVGKPAVAMVVVLPSRRPLMPWRKAARRAAARRAVWRVAWRAVQWAERRRMRPIP